MPSDPVKVSLFGAFGILRDGEPIQLHTRPTQSLCAFLASRAGKGVARTVVGAAVWPDSDAEKASNSTRTALVHIRQALSPAQPIQSDRLTITFSTQEADTDLLQAERLYRQSRVTQNLDEEREALTRLLGIIGVDFLADWPEAWTEEPRRLWGDRRIEAALRLANIAFDAQEFELAEEESLRALAADEFNEEAWATHLRAKAAMGRQADAIQRFRAIRQRRLDEIDLDFSPELLQLARQVTTGKMAVATEGRQSREAGRELIARAADSQMGSDPRTLLPLFASESFRNEAMKNPAEAWLLLKDLIERTEGIGEDRVRVMALAIRLADMVDEYGMAADYGEWLVENLPPERQEHRSALNMLGFMSFELREWDDAWRYLERFLQLAETHGNPREVSIAKSQMAALMWHQGDLAGALREYQIQEATLEGDQSVFGLLNLASLKANIGIVSTVQHDWPAAKQALRQAYSLAVANHFDFIRGFVMAPYGVSQIVTGEIAEGKRSAAMGFSQTFRSRYRRFHQISADYAAAALVATGHVWLGQSVLAAYSEFRAAAHHGRSASEERFVEWIGRLAPAATVRPLEMRPSELVAMVCEKLEGD